MKSPQLMGILNLTADSFSADGVISTAHAIEHVERLIHAGADIVDIGAESTRPGAQPVPAAVELSRLTPLLTALQVHPDRHRVRLSLDSYHADTVRAGLALGIDIINDVSGLRDPAMLALACEHAGDVVVMHALSIPADTAVTMAPDCDIIAEIIRWREQVIRRAADHGIDPDRLVFDPGIGFGKTPQQSWALVMQASTLVASGGRWLFGHSRKSFLRWMALPQAEPSARDDATLAVSLMLAHHGVHLLRVHAVARHRAMLAALCT